MYYLDSNAMAGVTNNGIALVTQNHNISIELAASEKTKVQLLHQLASGFKSLPSCEELSDSDAAKLVASLVEVGALVKTPGPPPKEITLAEAIQAFQAGYQLPETLVTAEELLIIPKGLSRTHQQRILRAFIAGITPLERLRAYAYQVTANQKTVFGDIPDAANLERAQSIASELSPELVNVIQLDGFEAVSVSVIDVLRSAESAGRLTAVRACWEFSNHESDELGIHLYVSEYACPNLSLASSHSEPTCQGIASSARLAELKARAEAAERFMSGEIGGRELVRFSANQKTGAVADVAKLIGYLPRQYESHPFEPYSADTQYLWVKGLNPQGSTQWIPAEMVFYPFRDPRRASALMHATSSGIAAHTNIEEATERAVRELVERDAYMWTWLQRVSRERISIDSLPEMCKVWANKLLQKGYETDFVNLTLDSHPVVLCAVNTEDSLMLGASCHPNPAKAALKAFEEAASVLWGNPPEPRGNLTPQEVSSTIDHQRLYIESPLVKENAAFLYSSLDQIKLSDVRIGEGSTLEAVSHVGESTIVNLSGPACKPLHVVRAFVPGLIPISFGYDQEPLGMQRLQTPIKTVDGGTVGAHISFDKANPILPHPFA